MGQTLFQQLPFQCHTGILPTTLGGGGHCYLYCGAEESEVETREDAGGSNSSQPGSEVHSTARLHCH